MRKFRVVQYGLRKFKAVLTSSWLDFLTPILDTWHKLISGEDFVETLNDIPAIAAPVAGSVHLTSYAIRTEVGFNQGDSSGFVEVGFWWSGGIQYFFNVGVAGSSDDYMRFFIDANGNINIAVYNSGGGINGGAYITSLNLKQYQYYVAKVVSDGSQYIIYLDGVSKPISIPGGGAANDGSWLSDIGVGVTNRILIGAVQAATVVTTAGGYIAYVNYNDTNKWILNTRSGFIYDVVGEKHLTWTLAGKHYVFVTEASLYLQTNGYSLWQKAGSDDIQVPYKSTGVPLTIVVGTDIPAGYAKTHDVAGSLVNDNLSDKCYDFQPTVKATSIGCISTSTATLQANSATRNYLLKDRRARVRQKGKAYGLQLKYRYNANVTEIKLQIWRIIAGVYTLITTQSIFSALGTSTTGIVLNIAFTTPIDVEEGDLIGFVLTGTTADTVIYRNDIGGIAGGLLYTAGEQTTGYNWALATPQAYFIPCYLFMARPNFVGIGDSLMSGQTIRSSYIEVTYDFENNSSQIPYQIRALQPNLIYQNMGYGGDRVDQVLARFDEYCVKIRPIYALIEGGINDLIVDRNIALIEADILAMVDLCITKGIYPIVLHVFPATGVSNARMQQRDLLKANLNISLGTRDCLVVDLDTTLGQFRAGGDPGNLWDIIPMYQSFGVHLNEAGYTVVAQKVNADFVLAGLTIPDMTKLEQFNRSNVLVSSALSRSSAYYDSLSPFRFHVSELLEFDDYNKLFESNYQDKVFVKPENALYINEILNCTSKQTGNNLSKIKFYCGIT